MIERRKISEFEFQNMSFSYSASVPVFDSVNLVLPKAKMVWLRSYDGRGKSTLLKIFAGLLMPQSGRYLINGEDVTQMSFEQFLDFRINMGYGFDMYGLLNNKSIFENLILPLEYHKLLPRDEAKARVDDLLRRFDFLNESHLRPFAVTGTHRKLTCVLRAFVHNPEVVFLDDPLIGLKHENLESLYAFIEEGFVSRGLKQVIFTSEAPELANRFRAENVFIAKNKLLLKAVG